MRIRESVVLFVLAFMAAAPVLVAQEESPRVVTMSMLIDGTNDIVSATESADRAFYRALAVFEKKFNIRLKMVERRIGFWFAPSDNFDANKELVRLVGMDLRHKSDIVIAFTTKKFFGDDAIEVDGETVFVKRQIGGIASLSGSVAIVTLEENTHTLLLHEIGHLFGVDHSFDPNSVMNGERIVSSTFDEKSKEVILANRNRQF